ncbi:MAG: hypothetical protein OEV00_02840 [Acidobacteriota bacterium]|nr:hypothetical protein [Acidobacteriota bacterium]MDH3784247.1 hypothetical protein [Acidobacteriota bacterium]
MSAPVTHETPDQLLERLERMGLGRVKKLLSDRYFEDRAVGLVTGWVARQEQEIEDSRPKPIDPMQVALQEANRQTQQALKEAAKAQVAAKQAQVAAQRAQRQATIALVTSCVGILTAILAMFAMAIR